MTVLEEILKIITAQAESRNDARAYIRSKSRTFLEHVIKVLVWGNQLKDSKKHWINNELIPILDDIIDIRLKSNNKRPKIKDYKESLFDPYAGSYEQFSRQVDTTIRRLMNKEIDSYPNPGYLNMEELWNKYQKFTDACLRRLSSPSISRDGKDFSADFYYLS